MRPSTRKPAPHLVNRLVIGQPPPRRQRSRITRVAQRPPRTFGQGREEGRIDDIAAPAHLHGVHVGGSVELGREFVVAEACREDSPTGTAANTT